MDDEVEVMYQNEEILDLVCSTIEEGPTKLLVQQMAIWAMLKRNGDAQLNAEIFFHIVQDMSGGTEQINVQDVNLRQILHLILDIAVKFHLTVTNDPRKDENFNEAYEKTIQMFVKDVFLEDETLDWTLWEMRVAEQDWIFDKS